MADKYLVSFLFIAHLQDTIGNFMEYNFDLKIQNKSSLGIHVLQWKQYIIVHYLVLWLHYTVLSVKQ